MLEETCDTQLEAVNCGIMGLRFFRRAEGPATETLLGRAAGQLARFRGRLERELEGRPWMNGKRFGGVNVVLRGLAAGTIRFSTEL